MTVVTGAGFRLTKNLGGRRYTLRAPTFGEAGALLASTGPHLRPTPAVIAEEVREALRRAGREELVAAIDEYEVAEDYLRSVLVSNAGAEGADDRAGAREAERDARDRMAAAHRARQRAEWLVREDGDLARLRRLAQEIDQDEIMQLLCICLVGWEGEGLPPAPEKVTREVIDAALPSGDVQALGGIVMGLMQPTKAEEGNSAPPSP